MSWLVSSLANSLKIDDHPDDPTTTTTDSTNHNRPIKSTSPNSSSPSDQSIPRRGVKDDFSELSTTLTRNLWGVASFLAPPPHVSDTADDAAEDTAGIRSDLSEFGGKFRTEISKLSGFTKMASNLIHFAAEEELSVEEYAKRGVVGVTDEVVTFARHVAMHPETWLDFPLPPDDDEDQYDDFELSDAQQEHAWAVERLAPELAALKTELCLSYTTEGFFWKIYFVLVHPRLSKHDALILSTPPILEARALLTHELRNRGKTRQIVPERSNVSVDKTELSHEEHLSVPVIDRSVSTPVEIFSVDTTNLVKEDVETEKHTISSTEVQVIDKAVVKEVPLKQGVSEKSITSISKSVHFLDENNEDDADDWLKDEESIDTSSYRGISYPLGDDDDVSFSDLEDDDDPAAIEKGGQTNSSAKESSKVSTHILDNKASNDWLDFEDFNDA